MVAEAPQRTLWGKRVGEMAWLAYQRHQHDLLNAHKRGLYYDEARAADAIRIVQKFRHTQGKLAGQCIELEEWQRWIVGSLFGWVHKDTGLRRFRTAYIRVGRKNGKSTLGAAIGNLLAWFDGEPGAQVYSAATKADQARVVFDEAKRQMRRFIGERPELSSGFRLVHNEMECRPTDSIFKPLTSDVQGMDGKNVHGAVIDELHAHPNRGVFDSLDTACGAREQAMMVVITTAGDYKEDHICLEQDDYLRDILEGRAEDDTYFGVVFALDAADDWHDKGCWEKANPNLGVSVSMLDLERNYAKAAKSTSAAKNFQTKRLNLWVHGVKAAIDMAKWKQGEIPKVSPKRFKPETVWYGGLDIASVSDLTCLLFLCRWHHGYFIRPFFFAPQEKADEKRIERARQRYDLWATQGSLILTPGYRTDQEFIKQKAIEFCNENNVRDIGYDPYNAEGIAASLTQEHGITMVAVRQGRITLSPPSNEFELTAHRGHIYHEPNPVMDWCVSNVAWQHGADDTIKPVKVRSAPQIKIDGAVACITALSRAMAYVEPEYTGPRVFTLEGNIGAA